MSSQGPPIQVFRNECKGNIYSYLRNSLDFFKVKTVQIFLFNIIAACRDSVEKNLKIVCRHTHVSCFIPHAYRQYCYLFSPVLQNSSTPVVVNAGSVHKGSNTVKLRVLEIYIYMYLHFLGKI